MVILFAGVQNVNSLDGKSSVSEHAGTNFWFTSVWSFKLFATTPDLPISQNYRCFASKCPSKSFNFGQIFCYSTSVPISLQPHTVKTMAIWLEREKLGQICHVFQGPKNLLAILILPFFSLVFTLRSTNKAILVLSLSHLSIFSVLVHFSIVLF